MEKLKYYRADKNERRSIIASTRSAIMKVRIKNKVDNVKVNLDIMDNQVLAILSDVNCNDYLISYKSLAGNKHVFKTDREDYIILSNLISPVSECLTVFIYSGMVKQDLVISSTITVSGDTVSVESKSVSEDIAIVKQVCD